MERILLAATLFLGMAACTRQDPVQTSIQPSNLLTEKFLDSLPENTRRWSQGGTLMGENENLSFRVRPGEYLFVEYAAGKSAQVNSENRDLEAIARKYSGLRDALFAVEKSYKFPNATLDTTVLRGSLEGTPKRTTDDDDHAHSELAVVVGIDNKSLRVKWQLLMTRTLQDDRDGKEIGEVAARKIAEDQLTLVGVYEKGGVFKRQRASIKRGEVLPNPGYASMSGLELMKLGQTRKAYIVSIGDNDSDMHRIFIDRFTGECLGSGF